MVTAPAPSKKDEIQQRVLEAITGKKRVGAALTMGIGKTLIGLRDMDRILDGGRRIPLLPSDLAAPFLVAAPKTSVFQSWKDDAVKFGLEYLLPYIEFTTYISLPKRTGRYHKIYLDECHSLKDSHEPMLKTHQGAILGLTGSQPKHKGSEKGKLVKKFCPIAINYTTDEAVLAGILNDYRIIVHSVPLSQKMDYRIVFKTGGSKMSSEFETYHYWNTRLERAEAIVQCFMMSLEYDGEPEEAPVEILRIQRMQALMKFPTKEHYLRRLSREFSEKTILFANTQEQADRLADHVYYSGNKSNKANLTLFNAGDINRLACVQQLSEGINIPNLRVGIIWHSFGNERKASQRIGRLLRLNPDQTATVHVLMYADTVDEQWVASALEKFDANKIFYVHHTFSA